jgi:predicted DNA-binding transcriptional regulator AlpA
MQKLPESELLPLYCLLLLAKGGAVYISERHSAHFDYRRESSLVRGRQCYAHDQTNPRVIHYWDQTGRYERQQLSDFEQKLRLATANANSENHGKRSHGLRQKTTSWPANHPMRHRVLAKTRRIEQLAQRGETLRLIQLKEVCLVTGFGKTFIYDSKDFPKPVKLGDSRRAAARWVESEVVAWVQALMSNREDGAGHQSPLGQTQTSMQKPKQMSVHTCARIAA